MTLFVLLTVILLSLAADLLYPLLDPRVRRWRQPFASSHAAQTAS